MVVRMEMAIRHLREFRSGHMIGALMPLASKKGQRCDGRCGIETNESSVRRLLFRITPESKQVSWSALSNRFELRFELHIHFDGVGLVP